MLNLDFALPTVILGSHASCPMLFYSWINLTSTTALTVNNPAYLTITNIANKISMHLQPADNDFIQVPKRFIPLNVATAGHIAENLTLSLPQQAPQINEALVLKVTVQGSANGITVTAI